MQQAKWANFDKKKALIKSFDGTQLLDMHDSDGTATPLVLDAEEGKNFGADIIRFKPNEGVRLHKHPGAHILMVTKGVGLLTYQTEEHKMFVGMIYLIPANTPHAIKAHTELVLVSIGNDHQQADSSERLDLIT